MWEILLFLQKGSEEVFTLRNHVVDKASYGNGKDEGENSSNLTQIGE